MSLSLSRHCLDEGGSFGKADPTAGSSCVIPKIA
jgi:hypothetical protein